MVKKWNQWDDIIKLLRRTVEVTMLVDECICAMHVKYISQEARHITVLIKSHTTLWKPFTCGICHGSGEPRGVENTNNVIRSGITTILD